MMLFSLCVLYIIILDGYPPTSNAYPECFQVVVKAASTFVGHKRAQKPIKTMGAEDFSFFLQERKGNISILLLFLMIVVVKSLCTFQFQHYMYSCYCDELSSFAYIYHIYCSHVFMIGCFLFVGAALQGEERPHHKSVFDFDERALMVSSSIFVQIIRNKLGVH